MIRLRLAGLLCLAAAASLSACGPSGGVASPGSTPAASGSTAPIEHNGPALDTAANAVAAVADATLPPPSAISPTAKTTIDDAAITVAWESLDTAAYAADALLAVKPRVQGTPAAKQLAAALEGTSTWLTIASQAQRAGQAENYRMALEQAKAALAGARTALGTLKGN